MRILEKVLDRNVFKEKFHQREGCRGNESTILDISGFIPCRDAVGNELNKPEDIRFYKNTPKIATQTLGWDRTSDSNNEYVTVISAMQEAENGSDVTYIYPNIYKLGDARFPRAIKINGILYYKKSQVNKTMCHFRHWQGVSLYTGSR